MSLAQANRLTVLGCPVDQVTGAELRARLPGIASGDGFTHLVTLNPEQVMQARSDPLVRAIIAGAEIVTADGVGITVAIRLRGERPPERITGVEIVDWIAALGLPMFLLGGGEDVAQTAADRLRDRLLATQVVGFWAGGTPDSDHDDEAIQRIAVSGARVVCVAYGAPAQLIWIDRNRQRLHAAGVRLAIGVGGALDYHAGSVRRPPRLVRNLGLEWLLRLIREPRRWRRQVVLPLFAGLAVREAIQNRIARR